MTLLNIVVGGGVVLAFCLAGVLASLRPSRHPRPMLCLRARPDAGCPRACVRTCLVTTSGRGTFPFTRRTGHVGGHA